MPVGTHVSTARGVSHAAAFAVERGCDAAQIFSSSPRGWALSHSIDDNALRLAFDRAGVGPVLAHTPYLLNIAAQDEQVYTRSVACLVHAAGRARTLGGWVIVHAGQAPDRDTGLERAAAAVITARALVPRGRIAVELTAGGRGAVAAGPADAGELLSLIGDDPGVAICLDTCHLHAAGYEIGPALADQVEQTIGWHRVAAVHANDSRDERGSRRDRHWHIGDGQIGDEAMRSFFSDPRLRNVTIVCETPGDASDDARNIAKIRGYLA